jgi:RNA polymerase sigma-70 factor (ECF subfamily)
MQANDSSLSSFERAGSVPPSPSSAENSQPSSEVASWITSARGGSNLALGQLLEVCEQYLMAIGNQELQRELHAKVAASDLVQETFLKAHCDFQSFHGNTEAELLAWLRKILLNSLFNHARRYRSTEKRDVSREMPLEPDQSRVGLTDDLVADVKSPSRYAIANEESRWLDMALQRLPEDQQQAIRLRTQLGFSFADVGQQMNRSAEAARKLWSRGIERLQEELENYRGA